MDRAYTVKELDALRNVCENRYLFGRYSPLMSVGGCFSRTYTETDKYACVEQMVRTHMMAGHTAQDLLDSELPATPRETQS